METDRYMKMKYVRPDFLFVERWEGSYYCPVDAVYKKSEDGFKRVFRRRHRKGVMYARCMFPVTEDVSSCSNEDISSNNDDIGNPKLPQS